MEGMNMFDATDIYKLYCNYAIYYLYKKGIIDNYQEFFSHGNEYDIHSPEGVDAGFYFIVLSKKKNSIMVHSCANKELTMQYDFTADKSNPEKFAKKLYEYALEIKKEK